MHKVESNIFYFDSSGINISTIVYDEIHKSLEAHVWANIESVWWVVEEALGM